MERKADTLTPKVLEFAKNVKKRMGRDFRWISDFFLEERGNLAFLTKEPWPGHVMTMYMCPDGCRSEIKQDPFRYLDAIKEEAEKAGLSKAKVETSMWPLGNMRYRVEYTVDGLDGAKRITDAKTGKIIM